LIQVNTLCLLVKGEPIQEILLGFKKVGFGEGKYVGIGGTVEAGETVRQTAVRELREEANLIIAEKDLNKAARITFTFPARPEWNRVVYIFLVRDWRGEPSESREIEPSWFRREAIPYEKMWADAAHWLPLLLDGKVISAGFTFNEDNETLQSQVIREEKDFLWLHLKSLPYFRALLRSVEASYYQDFELPEPILDLGSGDGHFASLAFDHPLDVGLDPWWGPLKESKRYHAYKALIQGQGFEMPFPSGYFASAVSNSVLEHIPEIDAVLVETARVLKPGAPFLFCCPNPGYFSELSIPAILRKVGLRRLGQAYEDWFGRMSRTYHADTPEVWEARLEKAGFRLERWWHYFSPAALHVLEWGHYFGGPTLLPKKLFGRWILAPTRWNLWLTERLVRPYAGDEPRPDGTYTFFVARKR
jgi:SAM-dependent methyltransferase/8-oxo-dGTP pyrophosphatase MutT (NUDIX family)